jgi:hypothetical protein
MGGDHAERGVQDMQLYRNEGSIPKFNAQRNLMGRTHYVDDDTLRWHKSRVLSARCTDGGLLFAILTSDALDMHNTKRGYRYMIFDLFGTVLSRVDLENAFTSSARAEKAMWDELNKIDAVAVTLAAIEVSQENYAKEMQRLRETVNALIGNKTKGAA